MAWTAKSSYASNDTAKEGKPSIEELITNISPKETPLFSSLSKGSAKQVKEQWQEDTLEDGADNAKAEGFSYTVEKPGNRSLLYNVCQIFWKGYGVTKTNQAIDKYGVKDELAYQMSKAMIKVAKDAEYAILNNSSITYPASEVDGESTARKMGGIPYFVTTNVYENSGTPRELTEALIATAQQDCWQAGGNPTDLYCCATLKKKIGTWLNVGRQRIAEQDEKKLHSGVDIYEGDFGTLTLKAHRDMASVALANSIYILDPDYVQVLSLRPFEKVTLPETRSAKDMGIEGEYTMKVKAEKAHAIIEDVQYAAAG